MHFQLQHKSMTLNNLERGRNGRLMSVVLISCVFSSNNKPVCVSFVFASDFICVLLNN